MIPYLPELSMDFHPISIVHIYTNRRSFFTNLWYAALAMLLVTFVTNTSYALVSESPFLPSAERYFII
jgi:hypothetical protein